MRKHETPFEYLDSVLAGRKAAEDAHDKFWADHIFNMVKDGTLSKLEAMEILTKYELLPVSDWIEYPPFMEPLIDGDGSISQNGSSNAFSIIITAHKSWLQFYQDLMTSLNIPEHITERDDKSCITIRICRREIIQLLQDVIVNNNLFHLERKWNKLITQEPSASVS